MKEPLQLHNQAEWEQAEARDLEDINQGYLHPQPTREIEATVTQVADGVEIMPKDAKPGPLAIKETADRQLLHQLVEEPLGGNPNALAVPEEIEPDYASLKRQFRESLVWYGLAANYFGAMAGDRVMIEMDGIESEYACRTCAGKGYTNEPCGSCNGTLISGGGPCRDCYVVGFGNETKSASGYRVCRDCSSGGVGTGWKGRILIPEKSQDIPMSGHIVSVGPKTKQYYLGDRVVFSRYAGVHMTNLQGTYAIMREEEIMMLLKEKK